MPVVLARIDDRLVHGQVAVGWARATNAEALVVVNDAAAADPLQKSLMQLATPAGLTTEALPVGAAAAKGAAGGFETKRTILLFASPGDALRFAVSGGPLTTLNVGGMRHGAGKKALREAVCVDDRDCDDLRALAARGIELETRLVPTDRRTDILPLLPTRSAE